MSFYVRFSSYAAAPDLKGAGKAPAKNIKVSLLDMFPAPELKRIDPSNLMLISLLEIGNTIDGVTIASKTLDSVRGKHDLSV